MTKQKKSTFKVLFYLKKSSPNKNELVPVMGRITIDGGIAQFSTKMFCDFTQWDLKFGRISGRSDEAVRINERLSGLRGKIDQHYREILQEKGFVSARAVKEKLLGINTTGSLLLEIFTDVITEMEKMVEAKTRAQSTADNLIIVKNHVSDYLTLKCEVKDIAFREIDKKFVRGFDLYLRTKPNRPCCNNTALLYILLLNQVVNEAIERNIIRDNVVSKYIYQDMEAEETNISFLTKQEIEQLASATLDWKGDLCYRDFYLFCCLTGLAYVDVKNLTWDNIKTYSDDSRWIVSQRQKSKVPFPVKLLDTALQTMEKYRGLAEGNLVFPIPVYSTYKQALRRIAEKAGIDKRMTTHVARHTFATLFLTEGVPIESISKMLGHKNIKTT